MDSNKNIPLIDQIRNNLALILTIISAVFGYAQLQGRVGNVENQIIEIKSQQQDIYKTINSFGNDITYIRTTLDYLKQRI